jgi:methionyl-tRNA synthetase
MADGTFYITTPIYYTNGEPHIGHVYTSVAADAVARYHRLRGDKTFFLTGTDEHGQKIARAADEAGVPPQQLVDQMAGTFKAYFDKLGLSHDDFIRTTQERHTRAVRLVLKRLQSQDDIYLGSYSGWYDAGEEAFVSENDAKASDYKSPISGRPLEKYEEPSYFFRLTKYLPKLIEHYEQHPQAVRPEARYNEVLSKLRMGFEDGSLGDLSISRSTFDWGVPFPDDPEHVAYVWVDALTNYVSALGYGSGDHERHDTFWPANVHLIGKDILWFHAVYWPCMLMALGEPLPRQVFAHGWWTSGGKKMSKSLGNFIDVDTIDAAASLYGFDALRYHMLRAGPFGGDLDWTDDGLAKSYAELANVLGNGLNRVLKMTGKYREGIVPERAAGATEQDDAALATADELLVRAEDAWGEMRLQDAVSLPVEIARAMNVYVDQTAPFSLAKDPSQAARLDAVLATATGMIYRAAVALLPVIPAKAEAALSQMKVAFVGKTTQELLAHPPAAGHRLGSGSPLFPRLDK